MPNVRSKLNCACIEQQRGQICDEENGRWLTTMDNAALINGYPHCKHSSIINLICFGLAYIFYKIPALCWDVSMCGWWTFNPKPLEKLGARWNTKLGFHHRPGLFFAGDLAW